MQNYGGYGSIPPFHYSRPGGTASASAIPRVWANTAAPSFQPFLSPPVKTHRVIQTNRSWMGMYGNACIPNQFKPTGDHPRNDREERFEEVFNIQENTDAGQDGYSNCNLSVRGEPIYLHQWIIKPVPHSQNICVEGKKSLAEDHFWHSDVITERLDEKTVVSSTGSVYTLVGNMELMDAMAVGFPRSLVEAFWLGFPADWRNLIDEHFQINSQRGNAMDISETPQSDDEVSFVDEMDLDDSVTELNEEGSTKSKGTGASADLDEVDGTDLEQQAAVDDDDIDVNEEPIGEDGDNWESQTETELEEEDIAVADTGREYTAVGKKPKTSNDHSLSKWVIKFLANGKGIYVVGQRSDGSLWHSSAIERRQSQRKVVSCTGSVYRLVGNMDKLLALSEDLPQDIIREFKKGFPKEWQEVVQQHLEATQTETTKNKSKNKTSSNKSKKSKKQNVNSKVKKTSKTLEKSVKESKDKSVSTSSSKHRSAGSTKKSALGSTNKSVSGSTNKSVSGSTNKSVGGSTNKSSRGSTNKQLKKAQPEEEKYESRNFVITPRGQLVDLENLGRSRSGRLIKPPLHAWTRQSISVDGDSVVVKASTAGASQFLKDFEHQFQNIRTKIQPYYNPRQKNMDYSILNKSKKTKSSSSKRNKSKVQDENSTSASSDGSISKDEADSIEDMDSSSNRLGAQVKAVLENSKSKRNQTRKTRSTCYNQPEPDQTNNDRTFETYEPDESSDSLDRTIVSKDWKLQDKLNECKVVISPFVRHVKTRRGSTRSDISVSYVKRSTRKTKHRQDTDQKEEESMPTARYSTRARSLNLTDKTDTDSQVNTDLTANVSSRPSRSCNKKRASYVVITDSSETEPEVVPVAEPSSDSRKTRRTKKPADSSTLDRENTDTSEDHWTKEEKELLYRACKTVSVGQADYWDKVAALVGTKSADSCNAMFYQTKKAPESAKKTAKTNQGKPRATAITAKVGTLKRKQQLTDILKQHNENYEDDLFNSTPFRQRTKRKMPMLKDLGDNLFEELAKKQGHNAFETPKGNRGQEGTDVPFASPEKTPATHLGPEMTEQSFTVDGYVQNVVKRQMQNKRRSKGKSTVETSKPNKPKPSLSPPSMKLFNNYLKESQTDKENYVDSEQEEDYYWQDETGDLSQA